MSCYARTRRTAWWTAAAFFVAALAEGSELDPQGSAISPAEGAAMQRQLSAQAQEIQELRDRLDRSATEDAATSAEPDPAVHLLPSVEEPSEFVLCDEAADEDDRWLKFYADYDDGFVIRPFDEKQHPFELQVNGRVQFRHHAFSRNATSWTDNAGVTHSIRNRNAFDVERARLMFSGYALTPRLTYYTQLDGDTDGGDVLDFLDYWWGWEFSDWFRVQLGKRKVTAVRQWLLSSGNTRFVDRPMACDFFRPNRSVGLFALGDLGERLHYEATIANGYDTANIPDSQEDNQFTFAATSYWDALGDFGSQIVDFDSVSTPLVRIGHSFVYSPQSGASPGSPFGEESFLNLTDGTQLTDIGALAPGVTVSQFDLYLYGVDAAVKWRGWSADAEVFLQWVDQIAGNGPLPVTSLFRHGFYVEAGRFLIARKLDFNVRFSRVQGPFGVSTEYALGSNWYPLDTTRLKMSFDVTRLDGSPVQNSSSDILLGDDGVLFRTQLQAGF